MIQAYQEAGVEVRKAPDALRNEYLRCGIRRPANACDRRQGFCSAFLMGGELVDDLNLVGKYLQAFNNTNGRNLPLLPIIQSTGLETHISKRHPDMTDKMKLIPLILSSPDYLGQRPNDPYSVEFVKCFSDNLMVCVLLDVSNNYYYVSSFFSITDSKLRSRIASGRLTAYRL